MAALPLCDLTPPPSYAMHAALDIRMRSCAVKQVPKQKGATSILSIWVFAIAHPISSA